MRNDLRDERNPRSWQMSARAPVRPPKYLLAGIACAAVVFLLSSTLLIGFGAPQNFAPGSQHPLAAASPTDTPSPAQASVTAEATSTPSPGATPTPGGGGIAPTPPPTTPPGATPSPTAKATATATASPTATPLPASLKVTPPTSVDAVSCASPSPTPITISNIGGSPMTWSLSTNVDATEDYPNGSLDPGNDLLVTITWNAPVTSGTTTITVTANGSVPSVIVTVTCS